MTKALINEPEIITKHKIMNVRDFHKMLVEKKLHSDPVGQRAAVITDPNNIKNQRIIQCLYKGIGIGLIIVRDIRNCKEKEIEKLYRTKTNYDFLTIDGGHRCRSIVLFIRNKFPSIINGKLKHWSEMTSEEKKHLLSRPIIVEEKKCSSMQAIEIFRSVNSTTPVNAYEMIMCNDQSEICREVRKFTKSYPEYDYNNHHNIFDMKEYSAEHFTKPNERAIWFTYIFIVLHKTLAKSNCDAGDSNTKDLLKQEENNSFSVSEKDLALVKKFFDNLLNYRKMTQTKISQEVFAAFHIIWFKLFEMYGENFKLDMNLFAAEFEKIRLSLTGKTANQYNDKTIRNLENEDTNIKELVRDYSKSYSNGKKTSYAADIMWKELLKKNNNDPNMCGITVLDSKRSVRRNIRNEMLVAANHRCYIDLHTNSCPYDGGQIGLDDCVLAHNTPYAFGGKTEDGVIMCKHCHNKMGMMNLDEYINHLKSKEELEENDD